jgi:LytS/YehU family sensor histidine kinase
VARADGGRLTLVVRDNGTGLVADATTRGFGVGLTNVVKRLEHAYGADQRFELRDAEGGGAEAIITIPRRRLRAASARLADRDDPDADR